jgi:hypothetical protein
MVHFVAILALAVAVPQQKPANPQAAALVAFSERLNDYVKLREDLGHKLEPLTPTPSASELAVRQEALAAALRNARRQARPGDLIPPEVQGLIRDAVLADFAKRQPLVRRAALLDVPAGPLPGINRTYPEQAALATVPPLLLANLPRLPDNLQYRFFGRHVVILDGDVEIIIDYVRNALPPH